MRKFLVLGAAFLGAAATAAAASAETPFPSPTVGVFVASQTVTADGAMSNYFAPGAKVVFRAYAVDGKKGKVLGTKDVKFFYVKIPNQPNVRLTYNAKAPGATARLAWTGTWTVPGTYPEGTVGFKVLVKTVAKKVGSFVQIPVTPAQLTISKSPPPLLGAGPTASTSISTGKLDAAIYVDAVNGTRPAAAAPRPIGCTQTNVFKRGEQLVVRSWGVELASGGILSTANVKEAHWSIAGQPDLTMNWGAHGATDNRVWFWTAAWNIPVDYPLGDAVIKVTYATEAGKTATYDYGITIIP